MTYIAKLFNAWQTLPQPVRSAIVDAVESGLAAALAVQVAIPATTGDAAHVAATVLTAFAAAAIAALRRRAQAVLADKVATAA